jgi:hypothetical protein
MALVPAKRLPGVVLLPSHLHRNFIHVVARFVHVRKLSGVGFEAARRAVDNGLLSDNVEEVSSCGGDRSQREM